MKSKIKDNILNITGYTEKIHMPFYPVVRLWPYRVQRRTGSGHDSQNDAASIRVCRSGGLWISIL